MRGGLKSCLDRLLKSMRSALVGHSEQGRLLTVCYTLRDNAIRIISARKVTNYEAEDYARSEYDLKKLKVTASMACCRNSRMKKVNRQKSG